MHYMQLYTREVIKRIDYEYLCHVSKVCLLNSESRTTCPIVSISMFVCCSPKASCCAHKADSNVPDTCMNARSVYTK